MGGDAAGANLRSASYTTNSLNQYSSRTNPGAVDILGTADAAAVITVNGQSAVRRGNYFSSTLLFDNTAGAVKANVSVVGARVGAGMNGADVVSERTGEVTIAPAVEAFAYDEDGNLLSDGEWQYSWDGENRLVSMTTVAATPPSARKRLEFAYDFAGRRIQKKVYNWNADSNSYQLASTTKFVNDGWNTVAELDANNTLVKSYVWGQDISGSLSGAGGIGGLLLIKEGTESYQAGYDGNSNLTTLTKAATGQTAATYEYDAFGQTIQATGDYAEKNSFRFSSKYFDAETNLYYYGYRYYNAQTGRWLSKDPIEEQGGVNLYSFVDNNGISAIDLLGKQIYLTGTAEIQKRSLEHIKNLLYEQNFKYVIMSASWRSGYGDITVLSYDNEASKYAIEKFGLKTNSELQNNFYIGMASILSDRGIVEYTLAECFKDKNGTHTTLEFGGAATVGRSESLTGNVQIFVHPTAATSKAESVLNTIVKAHTWKGGRQFDFYDDIIDGHEFGHAFEGLYGEVNSDASYSKAVQFENAIRERRRMTQRRVSEY